MFLILYPLSNKSGFPFQFVHPALISEGGHSIGIKSQHLGNLGDSSTEIVAPGIQMILFLKRFSRRLEEIVHEIAVSQNAFPPLTRISTLRKSLNPDQPPELFNSPPPTRSGLFPRETPASTNSRRLFRTENNPST